MRISSRTFLEAPVVDMTTLQANVDRTQREVATGIRADATEPGNALRLDALDAANSRLARYATNAAGVRDRLNGCESLATDAGDIFQRARELALQASNGSLDGAARTNIAIEIRGLREQLVGVGNRTDSRGDFLLAGTRSSAPPTKSSRVIRRRVPRASCSPTVPRAQHRKKSSPRPRRRRSLSIGASTGRAFPMTYIASARRKTIF